MKKFTTQSHKGKFILFATILASGMAFLAGSVVNIALPVIQNSFDARITDIQWVVNAFYLALASLILISGSLGDHYGRKKMFLSGIALFGIGSLLSAMSGSVFQLIAFQAIAGIGAAFMIPESLAVINVCFVESQRGKVIGTWAGFSGGLAALGPFLGGWLVSAFGWPAVFWLNIPLAALAFTVALLFVPESKDPDSARLDWKGTLAIAVGLFGIAFGLIQAPAAGWSSPGVVSALTLGVLGICAFILTEFKVKNPLVPFSIFKKKLVLGANLVTFVLYFALNGVVFFMVLNLQQVQNYSPLNAGLAILPSTLLIAIFSGAAGSLADKIGPRLQMILGPFLVGLGMTSFIFAGTNASYLINFLPGLILFGGGMALTIAPLTKSALAVDKDHSSVASGTNNAISRIAGLMAIAVLGVVVITVFSGTLTNELNNADLTESQREEILAQKDELGGIEAPDTFPEEASQRTVSIVDKSFVNGFRWAMAVSAALAFLASIFSFFFIRRHEEAKGKPHHEGANIHH